jgi:hypothetical protein
MIDFHLNNGMKKVPLLKKRESVLSYPYNPLKEKALITHSTQYKWWDEKSLLYLKKANYSLFYNYLIIKT